MRAVKLLCLLLIVAVCVGVLQEYVFCHADHNRERIKGFYEEDAGSLDVVYLGASDVYSDIAPGYAYRRDGITGYLFATQANSILNYKSQLKNILSRQKDALVVIELNGALYDDDADVTKEANLRNYSDHVPLDFTKLEWTAQNVQENKAEYLFPIIKYHGIWNDDPATEGEDEEAQPTADRSAEQKFRRTILNDKRRGYNYLKGVLNWPVAFRSPKGSLNSTLPAAADKRLPLTELQENGLRDLLAYCRDEGLTNVVFARFPHIVTERTYDRYERSNTIGDIVAEYGYDYLNFERDIAQTGLDENTDFYNLDHLNVHGQQKFTAYLTDYLKEHYALAPHTLSAAQQAEWETCANYYEAYVRYNEELMQNLEAAELCEDAELIDTLQDYLPQADV